MSLEFVNDLVPAKNRLLVLHFLLVFARFEYALKRGGFISVNAEPQWDRFSSSYRDDFDMNASPALLAACEYFIQIPPMKQIQVGGELRWQDTPKLEHDPLLIWLLVMVRRVRNNLFHGGKFPFESEKDPARNATLLNHSLVILEACAPLNKNVESFFREN